MLVTEIKKAKQAQITVVFDTLEQITLDREYCAEINISVGDSLTLEQVKSLQAESDYRRARSRALWYLSNSDLSEKMLHDKLRRAKFSNEACNRAVGRVIELGLINDQRYASRLFESMMAANISLREAKARLISKGINRDIINDVLDSDKADPVQQIKNIVEKKYASRLNSRENVQKVFSALARKGFDFSDIRAVLREYDSQIIYSEE